MASKAINKTPDIQPLGKRKRVLAASLASTDNVDPLAIKRRKLEQASAAAQTAPQPAVVVQPQPNILPQPTVLPKPSFFEIRNPSPDPFELNLQSFDAAGGNDETGSQSDSDIEMEPSLPQAEKTPNIEEQDADITVEETDEEKLGKSYIILSES